MRRALLLTLVSVSLCAAAVGLALAQDEETPEGEGQATAPETPSPAEGDTEDTDTEEAGQPEELSAEDRARRAKVVARVGEETITVGDVEDAVNEQSPFMRARYRDPAQLRDFVQSMVRFELLARAAERSEVSEDPEVQRVVKQNAVQQLVRREFDQRITPESIPDEDIEGYYESHPEEFHRPELRRAAHIQVASRDDAERLLTKAREADAREFRRLAREHSLDPETRLRGGDLRYFDEDGAARNRRDPHVGEALAAAAFALEEVGDVVEEPIQVGERWSILKLTGRRPAESRSLTQASPTIRLRLWRQRRQQEMEDFVARLRREANVETHPDRLRPIRLDPPERPDEEEGEGRHGRGRRGAARPSRGRPGAAPARGAEADDDPEE